MLLACGEEKPDARHVQDILREYVVEHGSSLEDADFGRQVSHFLAAKKAENMAARTIVNYRMYLGMFHDYIGKKAAEVTTNDIRDFIAYLGETRNLKINSVQNVLNILRSLFTWLQLEELITKKPILRVKSFKFNKKEFRHPLTMEELERLRDTCKSYREKALIEFLFSSGCRLAEAIQIDVDKIDFTQRCVDIIGKGNKPRTVYFSIRAKLMIQEYLKGRKGGEALFSSERQPYQRLKEGAIQKILKQLGERAGLSRTVHPHVLRHTFATYMLNSGADIVVIQSLLGHSNVSTTQIYTELSQENVRREYQRILA